MKQLFNNLMYFQAIIVVGLLFFGCRRDLCDGKDLTPKVTNYLLTDNEKGSIPYNGNETLTFVSKFNDTAIFIGQGLNQKLNKVETRSGSIDCPIYLIDNYENIFIDFKCLRISSLMFILSKTVPSILSPSPYLQISNGVNKSTTVLDYAIDSTIVTDSIPWIMGFKKGKILFGPLNVIYNSKMGILRFESNDTLWTLIPTN
jgi:hypothetical protein